MLDMTSTAVNSSLQRARRTLAGSVRNGIDVRQPTGATRTATVGGPYVAAWESGDLQAVLDLFTDDAVFQMPPTATWFNGREAIAEFLPNGPLGERWKLLPTEANGQLAFGCYAWDPEQTAFVANSIDVIARRGSQVCGITAFLQPELLKNFGLPDQLRAT